MRQLVAILCAVVLLGVGAAIAVACDGGASADGNAGHDQYKEKPGCGPWKSDGYAGGSGYHYGQPPKDHDRGDCPNPPCDQYGHFTGLIFAGGSSHSDGCGDDCDQRRYSGYGSDDHGSPGDDCRHSSLAPSPGPAATAA